MATIFDSYIQPVRSVTQRMAELDALDMGREELAARRQQNALQALTMRRQMEADDQARGDRNLLSTLVQQFGGDENALIRAMRGSGSPGLQTLADDREKALFERLKTEAQMKEAQAQTTKAEIEADKERLATAAKRAELILQAVSTAKDQQSYMAAVQFLGANGVDVAGIPQQFDPRYVAQAGQMAMTVNERADQEWKAKGYDLDVQSAAETARSNRAGEALTARRDSMADARARESMAIQQGSAVAEAGGPGQAELTKRFGKAAPGYRWKLDGGLEAIPGGPADIKAGVEGEKKEQRKRNALDQAQSVLSTIKDAKDLVGVTTAGVGGVSRVVPATPARDLSAKLETIKANLGFDRLQQMREASPTGGALGQVAVQELNSLQATVASLDQLQSPSEVRRALDKIEGHYKRWADTLGATDKTPAAQSGMPDMSAIDAELRRRGVTK